MSTWTDVTPRAWAGALCWIVVEPLENGCFKWAMAFPPTRRRYLHLSPAAPVAEPWTIAETEALE